MPQDPAYQPQPEPGQATPQHTDAEKGLASLIAPDALRDVEAGERQRSSSESRPEPVPPGPAKPPPGPPPVQEPLPKPKPMN